MSRRARPMARFVLPALMLGLLLAAACNGDDGDDGNGEATATPTPTAAEILDSAAARMEEVESFRFVLEHEDGSTTIAQGIEMDRAEGAFVRPDRLETDVEGRAGPVNAQVSFVLLPDGAWMTNPLTGRWQRTDLNPTPLSRLVTEVPALMRSARDPAFAGEERVDGQDAYVIEATLSSDDLGFLVPDAAAGREVPVTAWVGRDDLLVYRIEVSGPIAEQEPDGIVRRLRLSDFGADIAIEPPR